MTTTRSVVPTVIPHTGEFAAVNPPRMVGVPAQLTSFVGRDREIELIQGLLASTRLLTLTGSGGSGKTRLAVEVVARPPVASRYAGVWVDLAPVRNADLVPDALLDALGVREDAEGGQSPTDRLLRFIGARPFLLVLDNCEHLVDATAALADLLLRTCPELRVVATSREALGVTAETAWLVPPLSLPDADGRRAEQSEAVQLFIDRAHAVLPGFQLTDDHRAAVAQICRRLDGLPLALELAAARLRVLTPEQIAARLDDRFKLLKTGNRAALARHQTLRAAIDWSYDLLDDQAKLLLARLSVFGGGFTLEAAESVCGGGEIEPDDVLDVVSGLVEKSLVEMRESGDSARFRLLETVRQYASERLAEQGELEDRRRRHAEFFFALVSEAEPHMLTARRPMWVDRLQAELDNIRQTLEWSREGDPELHMRLVGALHWFWFSTGQWPEARQWLRSALTTPISDRPTRDRAAVLFSAGAIACLQARPESGQVHLVEAEALAKQLGDRRLEAYVHNYRALAFTQVNSTEAEEHLHQALAYFRDTNELYGLRLAFLLMGSTNLVKGDLAKAVEYGEEGVRVARVFGLDRELAISLQTLGVFVSYSGDTRRATALLRESLEAMRRDPQLLFMSRSLEMLAWGMVEQGMAENAVKLYGAAEAIRETIGAKMWQADKLRHTPRLESARRAVGEELYAAARLAGRSLGVNEAVDFALDAALQCAAFESEEPTTNTAEYAAVRIEPVAAVPALRVLALGTVEVSVDGAPLHPKAWGYAKARELLLFLLLHPEGRTRDQVGVALWPDASPAQVRNNFHVTAHHLRKALGRSEWLRYDRDRYQISAGASVPVEFDAARFEREVTDNIRRARRGSVQIEALRDALALYRGEFAEGEPYGDWHQDVRDRLSRVFADGLETLGAALLAAARYDEAAAVFERLIRQEDLDEEAYRSLMLCRARAGDRTAAMREYRRLEAHFRRELESDPSPETAALFKKLQRGETV
jgi:non-specific serine/threonine protein kinase